jgi:hypothetical protein
MLESQKRHVTIGCDLSFFEDNIQEFFVREFRGIDNYPLMENPLCLRTDDIWYAVNSLALIHLGFQVPKSADFFIEKGFDVAVDFFCGDWWKANDFEIEALDKSRNDGNLRWVSEFTCGLLLGLLSDRWDDVGRVCSWVETDLAPEYMGGFFEPELVHVYRSIAASLRAEPMPGLEDVEEEILKCRLQRPKVLFEAWRAARAGDQLAFENTFIKSLEHFDRYFDPEHAERSDYAMPFYWIAPHHTVVALAAKRLGMRLPELTPKQEAWIMTRESLGLPSKG